MNQEKSGCFWKTKEHIVFACFSETLLRKERYINLKKCSGFYFDVFKAERCEHMLKLEGSFLRKNQDEGRKVIE